MLFRVTHITDYRYSQPVAEAYLEVRLTPPTRAAQRVRYHRLTLEPSAKLPTYQDFFGNQVGMLALPFRHSRLMIRSDAVIQTIQHSNSAEGLDVSLPEARQILTSSLPLVFDYLLPTDMVKIGREAMQWAKRYFSERNSLRDGLTALNRAIHEGFEYKKGSTQFSTDLSTVWRDRKGVCQDFTHIMLSVLRTAGLPSRYVCGYIETSPPPSSRKGRALVGSVATHAWVEVLIPGQTWVALDPTNNCWCGEQHIAASFGRDASEASPIHGTFKGAGRQRMKVRVKMVRLRRMPTTLQLRDDTFRNDASEIDPVLSSGILKQDGKEA